MLCGGALPTLGAALATAGYTSDVVAEARRRYRFLPKSEPLALASLAGQARLAPLIRLLALGHALDPAEAAGLAPAALAALRGAGLITSESGRVAANYCLLPHEGLLLAGDRPGASEQDLVHVTRSPIHRSRSRG